MAVGVTRPSADCRRRIMDQAFARTYGVELLCETSPVVSWAALLERLRLRCPGIREGDVIEDGHTVEGIDAGSRWRCRHEESLVGPARVVLDLDPGPPHAAGRRSG